MKFIKYLLISLTSILLLFFSLYFMMNKGYANKLAKFSFEKYLLYKGYEANIDNIFIENNNLYIDNLKLKDQFFDINIKNISIDYLFNNFHLSRDGFSFDYKFKLNKAYIFGLEYFQNNSKDLSKDNINKNDINKNQKYLFASGECFSKITNLFNRSLDRYQINIGDNDEDFALDVNFVNQILHIKLINVDIHLYKSFEQYINKDLVYFLDDFIKQAIITKGALYFDFSDQISIKRKLDNNIIENTGYFHLKDVELSYHKDFPNITNMNSNVNIYNNDINFEIKQANIDKIKLDGSSVRLLWQGKDNTEILINGKAIGEASSLSGFVSSDILSDLSNIDIDLTKINGDCDLNFNIIVPLKEGANNLYDIDGYLKNIKWNILNNKISFKQKDNILRGKFNGNILDITGDVLVNNKKSFINYRNFFIDYTESDNIAHDDSQNHIHSQGGIYEAGTNIVDLITDFDFDKDNIDSLLCFDKLTGKGKLHFRYLYDNEEHSILAYSDLSNLSYNVKNLSILKENNIKSDFKLDGKVDIDEGLINAKFSLNGEDNNLHIHGDAVINNDDVVVNIDKIIFDRTYLKSYIHYNFDKDNLYVKLFGDDLDLSNTNFADIFVNKYNQPNNDSEITNNISDYVIDIDINNILMKNQHHLNDLKAVFKYNHCICYEGHLIAFMDDNNSDTHHNHHNNHNKNKHQKNKLNNKLKNIKFELVDVDLLKKEEKWSIFIGDMGYIAKSIDVFDYILKGQASFVMSINKLHEYNIIDGSVNIKRLKLVNNEPVVKMLSLVSIPGLINTMLGKNEILFFKALANFHLENNSLTINDGLGAGFNFDINFAGDIDFFTRKIDMSGFVNPSLYGMNNIIKYIPVVNIFMLGNKNQSGLLSSKYHIEKYF